MSSKNNPSNFQEKLNQLEAIVADFERGDIDLDAAVAQFDSGMKLAEELKQHLDSMEVKVERIKRDFSRANDESDE